jgi:hypothetical protein
MIPALFIGTGKRAAISVGVRRGQALPDLRANGVTVIGVGLKAQIAHHVGKGAPSLRHHAFSKKARRSQAQIRVP